MPTFAYKAKEGPHKIIDGMVEAATIDAAISKILEQGLAPIDVVPVEKKEKKAVILKPLQTAWRLAARVGLNDVVLFTRQMGDLVEAAVPILRALNVVAGQTKNEYFRAMIEEMRQFVKDGGSLSDALSRYPKVFDTIYVNMVRSGEVSGQLEKMFQRLAAYLEKKQETIGKVRSSLAYPLLIIIVGLLTFFVLLTFVIPKLTEMFEDFDQALPWPTLVLIHLSSFLSSFWWLIAALLGFGIFYLNKWFQTKEGRWWLDSNLLRLPLLGSFLKIIEISQFARTLGTLLESGVTITMALETVWATVKNKVMQKHLKVVAEDVTKGSSLRAALERTTFFPEMAVNMIAVGEETGRLERSLYKVAETYERQADQTAKTLLSLLGPIILVVVVSGVAFIAIALLLPIFKMNTLL